MYVSRDKPYLNEHKASENKTGIFKQSILIQHTKCAPQHLIDRVNRFQYSDPGIALFPAISISHFALCHCHLYAELISVLVPLK